MKAGLLPLTASLLGWGLLSAATGVAAHPALRVAELAQADSLTGGLIATIGAVPQGSAESDYEGQLAVTLEQAGDTPAVVVDAIDQALARPGLPRPAVTALQVLRNQARQGRIRTTSSVGDLVTGQGAIFERSGAGAFASFRGGSDYTP